MKKEPHENRIFPIRLETERLLLRNMEPEDLDFFLNLWTDPEVTRYMGGPRKREILEPNLKECIENPCKDEWDLWPVIEKASGRPVGHCGLLDKEVEGVPEVEVVYVLEKDARGRGYASEMAKRLIDYAFTEKKLHRVIALIKPGNEASAKVAEACGLKMEKKVLRGEGIEMHLFSVNRSS